MKLPLSYSIRNLWTRRLTTVLTAAGMSLVVFVFAAILMLAQGLQKTLVQTGTADNVVVIRKGSNTEVQSGILRSQAAVVETDPAIATGASGERLVDQGTARPHYPGTTQICQAWKRIGTGCLPACFNDHTATGETH